MAMVEIFSRRVFPLCSVDLCILQNQDVFPKLMSLLLIFPLVVLANMGKLE